MDWSKGNVPVELNPITIYLMFQVNKEFMSIHVTEDSTLEINFIQRILGAINVSNVGILGAKAPANEPWPINVNNMLSKNSKRVNIFRFNYVSIMRMKWARNIIRVRSSMAPTLEVMETVLQMEMKWIPSHQNSSTETWWHVF